MCGIVGYIGHRQAAAVVLEGLGRLEYRGYDSAGIAVLKPTGTFATYKAVGKLSALHTRLEEGLPAGGLGIGHTRWATHGPANLSNAHPHVDCTQRVTVVQNGIVENYASLKSELAARGHTFTSQTDTEVLPHLIEEALADGLDLGAAVDRMLGQARGALAVLVASEAFPDTVIAARNGNAGGLVIGVGDEETFVASDLPALVSFTDKAVFLASGEVATLKPGAVEIRTIAGDRVSRDPVDVSQNPMTAAKGEFKHFMLKEIMEQPEALTDVLRGRVDLESPALYLEELEGIVERLGRVRRVVLTGCGTSYHAALVGRRYFESLTRLPVEVEIGSELRYRDATLGPEDLVISLTQSGETADTLAAMEEAARQGALQIVVTNIPGSQATRIADATFEIRAGLEVGVAATKTFTSSIVCLHLLALHLGTLIRTLSVDDAAQHLRDLARLPQLVSLALERRQQVEDAVDHFLRMQSFLFLGRGLLYPIALEGALKLKEISYIHAEGYAAGEMKHGPIALIGREMPTVALAPEGALREKMASNVEEIKARSGTVIGLLTDGDDELGERVDHALFLPDMPPSLLPVVASVPLQLFAYYMGVERGADVDQPRNLAKSVTVE